MTPEQRKEIEERVAAATEGPWIRDEYDNPRMQVIAHGNEIVIYHNRHPRQVDAQIVPNMKFAAHARTDIPNLLSALDAAEARAVAAEERVRELEEALKFSYTLACRGVDRIDEENKTAGPRLARVHRQRLTTMCNQIKKHVDQVLKAQGSGE